MFAILTAAGTSKPELVTALREALGDLEAQLAGNCSAHNWEYEILPNVDFVPMSKFVRPSLWAETI